MDGWMFGINSSRINVLRFSNNSIILHMLLLIFRKFFNLHLTDILKKNKLE